jgi:dTDP-4-amino-4,6-dideoxygalactose transaminase
MIYRTILMEIPFVNLEVQHQKIGSEVLSAIEAVLESKAFIQGKFVEQFELEFAEYHQSKFAVGCSNGTSALSLALETLGIGYGDEVIVPAFTFIATAEAVCHLNAIPVFVDINPETYCISVDKIEAAITGKTKAIIPVHIYGNPCDMDPILKIAEKYNLYVVEDCAQAHLGKYKDQFVGTFGHMGTFSFYPGKNLGAIGDAGLILCQDKSHAHLLCKLRDHGRSKKYEHDLIGYNCRMDGIQAAVLSVKLKYLDHWTAKRRENASLYDSLLGQYDIKVITPTPNSDPVYHLYVIQLAQRDKVGGFLSEQGISTGIHYPIPLHRQPAFSYLRYKVGDFPQAEYVAEKVISLPMCGELGKEQVEFVCSQVGASQIDLL